MNGEDRIGACAALVAARTGIDPMRRDPAAFARRIDETERALGGPLYPELARGGEPFDRLVESLVVPETRFFRDMELFNILYSDIIPEWAARLADAIVPRITLLSLGCSTGQEAWSLGATLLARRDLFPASTEFRIVGIDLSTRAIAVARRGEYGPDELRGLTGGAMDGHFVRRGDLLSPSDELRAIVRFHRANLLSPDLPALAGGRAAVALLKNVLFYFTAEAAERVLESARHLVAPGGTLALAPSECRRGAPEGFDETVRGVTILYKRRPDIREAESAP